ncbi:hypothetical protein yc1106_00267 [Curvularia clavata]|uniref:RING-type domain-containing protein n=1 Tax=Curvularia clavata TaxID=95742 RepID=A0A9Q8Z2Y9_CURCL|nr:hypothetical protein yc1106_00267 [Curvularia clavata]
MANGQPPFRGRVQDVSPSPAASQLRRGRRPLIDDDDVDEGMPGLNRFPPSRIPRFGALVQTDADGNTHELLQGVGGRIHHYVRTGDNLVTRDMGEEPTSAPRSPLRNNHPHYLEVGGHASGHFNMAFSELYDPFSEFGPGSPRGGLARRGDVGGRDDFPVELPYGAMFGTFRAAIEALDSPSDARVPGITKEAAAEFISHFTQPITDDDEHCTPNTECPICLEPPTETHECVRITNIPGCTHLIGRECLEGLLLTQGTQGRRVCPLCRTEWMVEEQQNSGGLGDSPPEHQGQGEFDGSPRDRRAGPGMGGLRPPHDNLRRSDRRPTNHSPVYAPEAHSPDDEIF